MSATRVGQRGPYMTASRALSLEQEIARFEERMLAKIDRLDQELASLREMQADVRRQVVAALLGLPRAGRRP